MSAAVQDAKFQVEKAGVPKNKQLGIIIKPARKELVDRTFDEGRLEEMADRTFDEGRLEEMVEAL